MDEQKLIELAKAGDRKALGDLVKKYTQTIYNFAYKICRDKEKAENTMSETFLSMVKAIHQFDGNSKLSTWLYRIVVNHCFMLARADKSHLFNDPETDEGLFDDRYFTDWSSLPLKDVENEELRRVLDYAVARLAPEYRIVFMLRDVEGNSTEETAEITGLTIAAVKSRLHRARAFLRKEITKAFQK
ncbi:MAG: DNA-directed RNA polymerase sigma-70 factor [Ignavibacteriales bacterium]